MVGKLRFELVKLGFQPVNLGPVFLQGTFVILLGIYPVYLDVIDPRGPLSKTDGHNDMGLWFTPVEIKAIDGNKPPYRFRLTTNEYRRAKAFVRDSNIPYVIRLVAVPDAGTKNWPEHTSIVAEKLIETADELNAVVDSDRFEEVVKGGYMNMEIQ